MSPPEKQTRFRNGGDPLSVNLSRSDNCVLFERCNLPLIKFHTRYKSIKRKSNDAIATGSDYCIAGFTWRSL
jgi:hypothetical protein